MILLAKREKEGDFMRIYVVNKGDTITSIARLAGIAPTRLAEDNGIGVKTRLFPGEEVLISEPTRQVYARRGDDLDCLTRRYGAKKDDLIAYNPELGIENTLYEGQYLTLKVGSARYGMGIGNGYYYSGCKREKFLSALPYTSYITVAAAVYDGEKISMLFNDAEIVKEAKKHGKLPLLRIYHSNASRGADSEFGKSAAMLAKSHGYTGVTLAGARSPDKNALRDMTAEIKRAFIECGLKLFIEDQLEFPSDLSDLADGVVLFYDKVGRASIPSFEEGEECLMRAYAEKEDSIRSFIDISPFAYSSGKYIPKA